MRHEAQLLANDNTVLKRVVRLLRVACMTTPAWVAGNASLEWTFNVPDGPAWTTVLSLVHRNIHRFAPEERLLILGLVEDAVRNVSWWAPDVAGAQYVAGIAHWLLAGFDDYSAEKLRKRVLKVLAKIPKADTARFEAVLCGTVKNGERRDRIADDFREILFSGLDGLPAARDVPEVIIPIVADYLLASDKGLRTNHYARVSSGLERYFGIKDARSHGYFPASALRGPWVSLLRHHPGQTLDFFVRVFNHSADWYAHRRFDRPLEPPWEVELTFADGTTQKQWANPRLWNLYRGLSVGPYVLQSLLMALESWLMNYVKEYPQQLDSVLVDILRRSESAALAAVVASIATMHPQASGEALLVLLSAPDYIRFDLGRLAAERQTAVMPEFFSGHQAENRVYESERKTADRLPHRVQSLEDAITKLQLGPFASQVHAILDRHKAALLPIAQQGDEDRRWRLAMHRMDLRQCTMSEVDASETTAATHQGSPPSPRRFIRFDPTEPEPDVKEMMDETAVRLGSLNARFRLLNWAYKSFKHDNSAPHDPALWQQLLSEAMSPQSEDPKPETFEPTRGGPGILAAVCIRDHWEELSALQCDWCIERVCAEVMADANQWASQASVQRFDMAADRACAWVLSLLPAKSMSETQRSRVQEAFAAAVTHPIDEVRWHAVWGIANNLSLDNRALAARCINALATKAALMETARCAEDNAAYLRHSEIDETVATAAHSVREAFWQPHGIALDAYENLKVEEWSGADANAQILTILSSDPDNPAAVAAFVRASQTLVKWWDNDDDRNREQGHGRNHDSETALSDRLQTFVMRTSSELAKSILEPILAAIDRHPREIHWIIQGLTVIEDSTPNTLHYWRLWELFANGIRSAKWTARLSDEYPSGSEMLSAIFLTSWWKKGVRHWKSLEGHAHHIHALFEALPPSWIVFDSYVRFLYHIGERLLPEAFGRVANSLRAGAPETMLADANTVFLLEVLLQRHVYGKPANLKREPTIRNAVIYLLDTLVENGSPAAFRMRDDFVTPAQS